ncbi:MAG: hypothetical protein JSS38_07290 [Nitrospira sp.]|nr:hypothetical protein [Nitrospira sp.]
MREWQQRIGWSVVVAAVFGGLSGCAAPTAIMKVQKQAEIDVSHYHTLAVTGFQDLPNQNISRGIEQALLAVRKGDNSPYFKLVARDQLGKVMNELGIGQTGMIDPAQAKKIGKVLGVDAIITGRVGHYQARNERVMEQQANPAACGGNVLCAATISVPCTRREAYVQFNANVINVETGVLDLSESPDAKLLASQCQSDHPGQLPSVLEQSLGTPARSQYGVWESEDSMLKKAADQAIKKFVDKFTPHYEEYTVTLMDKASGQGSSVNDKLAAGVDYAKSGLWPRATAVWEELVKQRPNCAACWYDLAHGYEAKNELEKAKDFLEKAVNLSPRDKLIIEAISRIEKNLEQHRKVSPQRGAQIMRVTVQG